MFQDRLCGKSAVLPLVLLWLAAHAFVLALILGVKFLTAKTMAVLVMAGLLLWWMTGNRRHRLPRLDGMV